MAKNVLRGRNLILKYNGSAIPVSTSCKLSLGTSTVDSTTKDDEEDWEEVDVLTENWSVSADKFVNLAGISSQKRFVGPGYMLDNIPHKGDKGVLTDNANYSVSKPVALRKGQTINKMTSTHTSCVIAVIEGDYSVGAAYTCVEEGKSISWTAPEDCNIIVAHANTTYLVTDDYYTLDGVDSLVNILANTPVEAEVEFDIEGETYTGNVLITQNDLDGTVKQNATQSISMQGTGPLVKK